MLFIVKWCHILIIGIVIGIKCKKYFCEEKVIHHFPKNLYWRLEYVFCKNIISCGFYGSESKHHAIWKPWNIPYTIHCIFQISKQLFSVSDALEYNEGLDEPQLEDVDVINVVELPPNKVDSVSEKEEFADEEKLGFGDSKVVSVPGFVEVSCNAVDFVPSTSEDPSTSEENKRPNILDLVNLDATDPTIQQASKKRKKSTAAKETSKKAQSIHANWNKSKSKPVCSIPCDLYNPSSARKELISHHGDKTKPEIFLLLTYGIYDIMADYTVCLWYNGRTKSDIPVAKELSWFQLHGWR